MVVMYSDNNISQEVDLLEKGELVNTQIPLQKKQNWLRGVAKTVLGFFLTVTILVFWTVAWQNTFTPPKGNQSGSSRQRCESPARRTEWRQLSKSQQRDFIDAVHCLAERPSILNSNLEGTTMSSKNSSSRYDDFVWVHIQLYEKTHNVAPSLPWHRYFIRVFEKTLQEECGYSSSLPYWDWTLDAENPRRSPIWDEEFGVGGNGTGTSHCVSDGPFKDWTLQWPEKHCLRRRFDPVMSGSNFTDEIIRNIRRRSGTYQGFRESLESGPHKAIHNSIGGEMPTHDSPNGKFSLFFLSGMEQNK
jgi:tyrosinase